MLETINIQLPARMLKVKRSRRRGHLGHAVVNDEPHNLFAMVPQWCLRKVRDGVCEQVRRHIANRQASIFNPVRPTGHLDALSQR